MPRREDIERFAQVLNSLGDEPAIRAARAETIEGFPKAAPAAEEPGSEPDELDTLGPEALAGEEPSAGEEAQSLQDIFRSLSDVPEGEGEAALRAGESPEEDAVPEGGADVEAEPEEEGLDYSSLFGEEAAPGEIEEIKAPQPTPQGSPEPPPSAQGRPPPQEPLSEGAPFDEEAFSFPEGEAASLQADLDQMETLPEEPVGGPEAPQAGAEIPSGAFEDFGSLEFPAEATAAGEEPEIPGEEALEAPQGGEEASAESFELPSLDDLTFAEQAPSEPSAPDVEVPSETPLESGFEAPSESFELPSGELPSAPPFEEPSPEAPQAEQPEPEPIPSFDLDTAALGEEPQAPSGETPSELPAGPGPTEEPELPSGLEEFGEESLGDLDEFSLPESAEQFGVTAVPGGPPTEPEIPQPPSRPVAPKPRAPIPTEAPEPEAIPAAEIPEGEIELTPEQFARLKAALQSLPRNLKITVQDLIGEGMVSGPDLAALLNMLLQGATAQEIATLAGRISGKRIRVPAGYEKRTGLAFEAEQRTFAYAFRENFLPLLRVVAITVLAGALFGFLGYNYIYRPLNAWSNYRAGYAQIPNDRFTLANERFKRATSVWPMKRWYYRYAEAFAIRRQYVLAEGKYEELLKSWPLDKKAILDYAGMESTQLADYEKADSLLRAFLDVHPKDYDVLLAAGDNDLAWASRNRDRFGAARLAYATLIETYGARNELLFRMLRYFIRTDNGVEVERLRAFYAARPEVKVDPYVYAELGGYLVDHRRLDYAQDVLFRADKVQPGLYEVHYNLARYYRLVGDVADEKKALDATERILTLTRPTAPITRRRLDVEIDTHTRLGEYYYRTQQYLPADRELQAAIRLVADNQQRRLIGQAPLYGRPYARRGDLAYYIEGDLSTAAALYQKAADNGYTSPELMYKMGFIQYEQKDYKAALQTFAAAEDASAYPSPGEDLPPPPSTAAPPAAGSTPSTTAGSTAPTTEEPPVPASPLPRPPENLLYALGNTFFQRGDFFAAQGYFLRVLGRLQMRRAAVGMLDPDERPYDRALLQTLVKVNNNLGVTMYRLAEKTGDRSKKSQALVYLSAANEDASSLALSPDTVRRSEDRPLPSLNMRGILYPTREPLPGIYSDLPRDFQALTW